MENNPLANRIEAYFSALEAPLFELPAARREEFLLEARAHVRSMVEARRADGMDEAAAWDAALRDFGDPQEVGRALWREWAGSGQLESEGAPLSVRDLVRRYGPLMMAGMSLSLLILFASKQVWMRHYLVSLLVIFSVGSFGWALWRHRRDGGQWTTSTVLSYGGLALILLNSVADLVWRVTWSATPIGHLANQCFPFVVCAYCGLWLYSYKRKLPQRPWRFGSYAARYKQSPVAAEQEYRLNPLVGLAMGAVLACVGPLVTSLQLFGTAPALLIWAVVVVVGFGLGFWLRK